MNRTSPAEPAGEPVHVTVDAATIEGNLSIPEGAEGIVLFAHETGSCRQSPRNNFVADELREGGAGRGPGPHPVHRGRQGHPGAGTQPPGP